MTAQRGNINFVSRPGLSRDVFRRTHWRLYRLILHARKCRSASLKASRNKSRAHICRSRFQKLREPVFARRSHYVAGMLCVVGSQLEWFRGVLSQDGQRRRTVDSVKLGKALFGLIVLHKGRIFWRQGERNWPILKSGTTGSTEGPIVPMIGRTTTFYPSILRLYRRGGLVTAVRPQSDIGMRMGACHACPREFAFTNFAVAVVVCNHHHQLEAIHCSSSERWSSSSSESSA